MINESPARRHLPPELAHLAGRPISLSEASRKYGIGKVRLHRMARSGRIRVLKYPACGGDTMLVDELTVVMPALPSAGGRPRREPAPA